MSFLAALHAATPHRRVRGFVPAHAGSQHLGWFHQQAGALLDWDLTELPELDALNDPTGALADVQAQAADACGVAASYLLVNGATVGIATALMASLAPNEALLIPRNAHRAAVNALVLTGAHPVWFMPTWHADAGVWGQVTVAQAQAAFQTALSRGLTPRALLITSPTYEGLLSPVAELATWCRANNLRLIVDEAHGGHASFLPGLLPPSACTTGADAVVQSWHKTLGSLTQSAVLHLPHGSTLPPWRVRQALNLLQSTSPSYLLLASLASTLEWAISSQGQETLHAQHHRCLALRAELQAALTPFQLMTGPVEPWRVWLWHPEYQGDAVADWLEGWHGIGYESANPHGWLTMLNVGLAAPAWHALRHALLSLSTPALSFPTSPLRDTATGLVTQPLNPQPITQLSPRDAFFHPAEPHPNTPALVGRVAAETVVSCPPGIPVVIPGEVIQPAHLPWLPETVYTVSS